jgi:hypothetical protein
VVEKPVKGHLGSEADAASGVEMASAVRPRRDAR